ncbi:MAG: thiamine pyrophosphate-binding protein [Alphaproteobacteria bacterium]|nr:MAG: thiamine pyrophosphate-binding protein [Alphaproteobacteria bacterium]
MKALVKQFLDNQISRRGFMKELTALGVSLASAEALLDGLISESFAQETAEAGTTREVTGNGADLMIESLLDAGVKYVFNGTGAGVNRFFDTIVTRPQMKNFLATNEGQCVAMAEGYHLASGELGVTIIPKAGLGNAAGNIYNALANRSSLLVITARESGEMAGRYGDLELVDWQEVMDPFMKWSYRIRHLDRVPELTRRAITVARTAPGGVSFLQMNEELYEQEGTGTLIASSKFHVTSKIRPKPEAIMDVAKLLLDSQNPLITVGYEVTRAGANEKMVEFADLLALRVTSGMSGFADFPTNHPLYLGSFSPWASYNRDADFYMSIGSPMPDEARYVHRGPPPPKAKTVHISLEPEMLAIAHPSDANIVADAGEAISDLIEAVKSLATKERINSIKEERYDKVRQYTEGQRKRRMDGVKESWDKAPMSYGRVSTELNDLLEDDAIIIHEPLRGALDWFDLGYGNKTELGVAGASILGWATGVALGAKIAKPDSQVVVLTGDGSLMFQHNLWALSRHDAPVIVVVYNNHCYEGTRAPNWARGGPQVQAQKDMLNYLGDPDVDFSILAKAYGVDGEVVGNPSELKSAIQRAIEATKNGKPYLLDVTVERWGPGGELTWHPETSVAAMRSRKI